MRSYQIIANKQVVKSYSLELTLFSILVTVLLVAMDITDSMVPPPPIPDESSRRVRKRCPHGKLKSFCKDCGGSQICPHDKLKKNCRECGGSAFCEHDKFKSKCKECGGSAFCQHGKGKYHCKDCGGLAFCQHDREKKRCKECNGSDLCQHDKQKASCAECNNCIYDIQQYVRFGNEFADAAKLLQHIQSYYTQ